MLRTSIAVYVLLALAVGTPPVPGAERFRRGDSNTDGELNISDAVYALGYLFLGAPDQLPCEDAADATDDGILDLSDPVRVLGYLFLGSPGMPSPFGESSESCGEDPTPDEIGCARFEPCSAPSSPPAAPVLETPEAATRASSIEIRGTTAPGLLVKLTLSRDAVPIETRGDAGGAFAAQFPLRRNQLNRIFAVAEDARGQTSAPASIEVIQDDTPPFVFIDEPRDGAVVLTDRVTVAGRISDLLSGFLGLRAEVNGQPATIAIGIGTNGTFERAQVPLALGENELSAVATDAVGNTVTRTIRITRAAPPPDSDRIELVSGDGQLKQPIHTTLPQPIVVRARRPDGTPLEGKLVVFRVTRSDGRLAAGPDDALDSRVLTLGARTDADGLASAFWTLGSDAGCGNNRVQATGPGLAGEVLFCASAAPGPAGQINIGTGNNQQGETGAPAREALKVWVSDGCNGVEGAPVTFRVAIGTGKVNGSDSATVITGPTGHAQVAFVFGPEPGTQAVEASLSNPGNSQTGQAVFMAHAIARDATRPTTFSGLVLDNAQQPIQGAVCVLDVPGLEGTISRTEIDGRFVLQPPGAGPASLRIEGKFASHVGGSTGRNVDQGSYPALAYEVTLVPNAENSLHGPILLPALNPENAVMYDGAREVVLRVKEIDGLEVRVAQGTLITLRDGSQVGPGHAGSVQLSLDQVHHDAVPMPMTDGAAPPFAWTLQPGGATFSPPAQIKLPNMAALPPGSIANFISFNHDTGKFEVVASGHVSADGSSVESDAGSGITVSGWGGACPPYTVTGTSERCSVRFAAGSKNQVVCRNQRVKLTAVGGPATGTMTWEGPGGTTPLQKSSTGSTWLTPTYISDFETSYSSTGTKTIRATWECKSGDFESAETKVDVVDVVSITATVTHIPNATPCPGVPEFPDDTFVTTSQDTNMVTNKPLVLPRKTKTLSLEAKLDPPDKIPEKLKWKVQRNTDDAESGPLPPQPPAQPVVNLDTDAQGSFHVVCYCDSNDNDVPDAGEPQKVLNLVLVGIEVTNIVATAHPEELRQGSNVGCVFAKDLNQGYFAITTGCFDFAQTERAAAHVIANVVLRGGGADRTLGVNETTVLFIQNFRGDSFTCHHAGGKTVKEVFACNPSTVPDPICAGAPALMGGPVLDGDVAMPTGGDTASASCCHRETTVPGTGGRQRIVEWLDSPAFICSGKHGCTNEAVVSTSGSNDFVALMVSYSTSAPHTYVLNATADWVVSVGGDVTRDGAGNLIWTRRPDSGIAASASVSGLPQSGTEAGIMVYGPTPIGAMSLRNDGR